MAKKKKKGAGAQDVDEMSKSEVKAYHKEICEFYLEHGWRETLSYYALSPAQGSEIIPAKIRKQHKEMEKEAKKAKGKKAKGKGKTKAKAKAKKKTKVKGKGKGKKKSAAEDVPKSKPKAKKRRKKSTKRKASTRADSSTKAAEPDATLDFLLRYRKKNGAATLDDVIIDLVSQSRKAA